MSCQQRVRNRVCGEPQAFRLWCPTWVSSIEGPISLCEKCARVFQPEHNENATGVFLWGDAADEAFRSVETIITRKMGQYQNAVGMIVNGKQVFGDTEKSPTGLFAKTVWVVDGKYWLVTYNQVTCLGDIDNVRKHFPTYVEWVVSV